MCPDNKQLLASLIESLEESVILLRRIGKKYPDSVRHPIIVDSHDWDLIPDLIHTIVSVNAVPYLMDTLNMHSQSHAYRAGIITRLVVEIIYVMGYQRGKEESNPFEDWVVQDSQ